MPYVPTDIKTRLEQSRAQLADCIRERDQLNVTIITLQNDIRALTAIVWRDELTQRQNDIEQAVVGISDAIRSVLRLKNTPMTAAQVKADLDLMGYNFANLANPSALVHNTLKRMAGTTEVFYDDTTKAYWMRKTIGQMIAEGGESWVGSGSAERAGMRGDEKRNPAEQLRDLRDIQKRHRKK